MNSISSDKKEAELSIKEEDSNSTFKNLANGNKKEEKKKLEFNNSHSSTSVNTLTGTNKRHFKQFSVKNRNISTSSFKTPNTKPNKNTSIHNMNDFLNTHGRNSPRSINSNDASLTSSIHKIKSIDEVNRKRHNHSSSGSFINGRQLAKTRSQGSNQSRQSRNRSSSSNLCKNSKSASPLSIAPANTTEDCTVDSKDLNIKKEPDYKTSLVEPNDLEHLPVPSLVSNPEPTYKKYLNVSSKTFQLESESEEEQDDFQDLHSKALKASLSSDKSESDIILEAGDHVPVSSKSSFHSKVTSHSDSNLLTIDEDKIKVDQKQLSYLVPSSYRRNSRLSADRISGNILIRKDSQSNSDLIKNASTTDSLTKQIHAGSGLDFNEISLQPQHLLQKQITTSNEKRDSPSTHSIKDDRIFPDNFNNVKNNSVAKDKNTANNNLALQIKDRENIDNISSGLLHPQTKKYDGSGFSSFSSSFMKDKDTSHQFNYINKDFLNSSISPDIKKYFSGGEKSETYSNEFDSSSKNIYNTSTEDYSDPEPSKNISDPGINLTATTSRGQKEKFKNTKQPNLEEKKLQQASPDNSNIVFNKKNGFSSLDNQNFLSSLNSTQDFKQTKDFVQNNTDSNKHTDNVLYDKASNVPRRSGWNNTVYNSNNLATKSLLKIATMANSNSPPIKKASDTNEDSFNDFNSFLKVDAPTEDKDSRTQQRLWLQRENSILDLSTDLSQKQFDSVFQASSVDAKRGFENIAKEYNSIKRYKNPLVENIKKVQTILGNEQNNYNKDTNVYDLDFVNGSTTVSTTTYSKSSVSNSNINGNDLKIKSKDNFDMILNNIWNSETKKLIDGQPNKFINNPSNIGQTSNNLMRQSKPANAYYRNSPRGIPSAGSFR